MCSSPADTKVGNEQCNNLANTEHSANAGRECLESFHSATGSVCISHRHTKIPTLASTKEEPDGEEQDSPRKTNPPSPKTPRVTSPTGTTAGSPTQQLPISTGGERSPSPKRSYAAATQNQQTQPQQHNSHGQTPGPAGPLPGKGDRSIVVGALNRMPQPPERTAPNRRIQWKLSEDEADEVGRRVFTLESRALVLHTGMLNPKQDVIVKWVQEQMVIKWGVSVQQLRVLDRSSYLLVLGAESERARVLAACPYHRQGRYIKTANAGGAGTSNAFEVLGELSSSDVEVNTSGGASPRNGVNKMDVFDLNMSPSTTASQQPTGKMKTPRRNKTPKRQGAEDATSPTSAHVVVAVAGASMGGLLETTGSNTEEDSDSEMEDTIGLESEDEGGQVSKASALPGKIWENEESRNGPEEMQDEEAKGRTTAPTYDKGQKSVKYTVSQGTT
ncbi:hypothetical protein R1sor_016023 [Riccia sorocarpa]|uniref:Uncharacterized protein n=1 Tax=Riccia sorocarpa TaxID=122646 RepID=A0ABD3HGZ8_9MARC